MHAINLYSDVLGQPGPRKRILQRSMEAIGKAGSGLIVLLMANGPEEFAHEVSRETGERGDLRSYGIGAQILADLGVHDLILLSNTPHNVVGIEGYELNIVAHQPIAD